MNRFKFTFGFIITLLLIQNINSQLVWNHACKLEGTTSSYVAVPNTGASSKQMHNYLLRPVTAECWVYPDNASQPEKQTLIQKGAGSTPSGFSLYLNQGRPSIKVNNVHVFSTVTAIPSQKWSHIAITFDNQGSLWSIYINGVLYAQQSYNQNKIPNSDSLYIGKGSENPFKGYVDEVRLWSKTLTTAEVSRNFRSTLATYSGFDPALFTPNDLTANSVYTGLMLSLTFQDDEQAGQIFSMSDWSGCGFNAKGNGVSELNLSNRPSTTIMQNECFAGFDTAACLTGTDNIYNSPVQQITLEAWYSYTSGGVKQYLIQKGTDYGLYFEPLLGPSLVLHAYVNNVDIAFFPTTKSSEWRHAAFTYNSLTGEYKLYYNGSLVKSGTNMAGAINNSSSPLKIGYHVIGLEDEARISDYVKSEQEIKSYMFTSIDISNHPNPGAKTLNYSLDGYSVDNMGVGGSRLLFKGNSRFSHPSTLDNIPVSPVNRNDNTGFSSSWKTSGYLNLSIPSMGFGGETSASIQVNAPVNISISDINVYAALNHTNDQDLKIYLISPQNDTILLHNGESQLGTNDNIITIFDDQADSVQNLNKFTSIGPVIKPKTNINSVLNGKIAAGTWKLLIKDNGNAADVGILYNWGLQINGGSIGLSSPGGNEEETGSPYKFSLSQNYPNPFNPSTSIAFSIPKAGNVKITVFDILGKEAAILVNSEMKEGSYNINFNAEGLSSGIYFYRLESGNFTDVKKMILIK